MDPQTLGRQAKSESKTERPHMSLQWAPEVATCSWADHPKDWSCTYMQRNTREINANHWMEVNTSGGMDEFVTWIEWPTFRMDNVQPT